MLKVLTLSKLTRTFVLLSLAVILCMACSMTADNGIANTNNEQKETLPGAGIVKGYNLLSEEGLKEAALDEDFFLKAAAEGISLSVAGENPDNMQGDINGDGKVNLRDALLIVRYLYYTHSPHYTGCNSIDPARGDVNLDGELTIDDAFMIVRYCFGLIDGFPVNLVKNGHFTNNTDNWSFDTFDPAEAVFASEKGMAKLEISNGGVNSWDLYLHQLNVPVVKMAEYRFLFKAKADVPMTVRMYQCNSDIPATNFSINEFDVTTEWKLYSARIVTFVNEPEAIFEMTFGGNGPGTLLLDNIILTQTGKVETTGVEYQPPVSSNPADFVRARGNVLVCGADEQELNLRGVAFGNEVWSNVTYPANHHNEEDFIRLKEMGANTIRFYLNYKSFEDDENPYSYKQMGWDWLDKNIMWAKKHGIYLMINIHVPQGGFQSNGGGFALWTEQENQERFIALWKAIAGRYAHEPAVAGYDILNEPLVTESVDQWKNLAERTAQAIREVDSNHLLIIEELLGIGQTYVNGGNPSYTQFLIDDSNVMYDFHFYYPHEYSHQMSSWTSYPEIGPYPNNNLAIFPKDMTIGAWSDGSLPLSPGTTEWTYLESGLFTFDDPAVICTGPGLLVYNMGSGRVYFDDFVINEYDEQGSFVRSITHDIEEGDNWLLWGWNETPKAGFTTNEAHSGNVSFTINGMSDYAAFIDRELYFIPKTGYSYSLSGWAKGEDIPADALVLFVMPLNISQSGAPVHSLNKEYLEYKMEQYLAFGRTFNVPMFVGEFGLLRYCYEDGRNGLQWTEDVLDLLHKNNVNYTYHAYHEFNTGIFYNEGGLPNPDKANNELIELLTEYFKQ